MQESIGRRAVKLSVLMLFALAAYGASSHPAMAVSAVAETEPSVAQPSGPKTRAQFRAQEANFPNHDGGIVGWAGDLAGVWAQGLANEVAAGYPLMRAQIDLGEFISRDLSNTYLGSLDSGFAAVRNAGAKVIVRFLYTSPTSFSGAAVPDASITQTLRHIAQLGPVLKKNEDVIMAVEAGFIGAWGEWHASGSGLTSTTNKALIKDALLEAFPASRQILFRNPVDVMRWHPIPVSAADAGTPKGRTGLHNDCLLSTPTDGNTFPTEASRVYSRQATAHVIYGGETCKISPYPQRLSCADIRKEGREYHLTYLNRYGDLSSFRANWKAGGCEQEVLNSIGIRMSLVEIEHPASAFRGSTVDFLLKIKNTGWSRLHDGKNLKLFLVRSDGAGDAMIDAAEIKPGFFEPKLPTEAPDSLAFSVKLPYQLAAGAWRVAISLRDAAGSLDDDPRYALRFANADNLSSGQHWDKTHGAFFTGTEIEIR